MYYHYRKEEKKKMTREFAALVASKDVDQTLHLWQSSGGTIFILCMIFVSLSVMSIVIFACADTETSSPKRSNGEVHGAGGGGCCCGGGGGGCVGCGCGGGGCGGGG